MKFRKPSSLAQVITKTKLKVEFRQPRSLFKKPHLFPGKLSLCFCTFIIDFQSAKLFFYKDIFFDQTILILTQPNPKTDIFQLLRILCSMLGLMLMFYVNNSHFLMSNASYYYMGHYRQNFRQQARSVFENINLKKMK